MADQHNQNPNPVARHPLRKRRRALFVSVYLLFILGLVWLAGRFYLTVRYGIPFLGNENVSAVWDHYYPELSESRVLDATITRDDGHFDVLLLGASVLDQVADRIEGQFRTRLGENVRVFNLSRNSFTTRDSLLKYNRLQDKDFDLIVVYHGINDVRMNSCQDDLFRDDYSHCFWYKSFQCRLAGQSLPVGDVVANLIPLEQPSPDLQEFGSRIKTDRTVRQNLESIVAQSQSKQQLVVLMTFAYCIPEGYSIDELRSGRLGYGQSAIGFVCPIELWGLPQHVPRTIDAHNQEIVEIADRFDNVIFVDLVKDIEPDGRHFSDPCHLTDLGCDLFAAHVMEKVLQRLVQSKAVQ